jgi:hypothetical protein
MQFVYHRRPPDLRGEILYPLNALRARYPDAYERQAAKYRGREKRMATSVPPLGLLWNDVLHLAPIHPHLLYRALVACGLSPPDHSYFAIPVDLLRGRPATVLIAHDPDLYRPFDPDRYCELGHVPESTLRFYDDEIRAGRQPLLYVGIPHVLVADPIDTAGLVQFSWC